MLERHAPLWLLLQDKKKRTAVASKLKHNQLNVISQFMRAFLEKKYNFDKKQLHKIRSDKEYIRQLAHGKLTNNQKREILSQRGGFLPAVARMVAKPLIGAIATVAGAGLAKAIEKI